jgi:hypothetical protein
MTASLGSGRFGGGVGAGSRGVWGTSTTSTAPSAATTLSESAMIQRVRAPPSAARNRVALRKTD